MIYFKSRSGRHIIGTLVIILITGLAFSSCKKDYVKYPYNDIERFVIKDANGADLKASIENDNIIVYYPPFQTVPDFINPQITTSDRATVEPASGTKVAFKTGTVFKVKAQDGTVKTYTLKTYQSAPSPTFTISDLPYRPGADVYLTGEFMNPDTTVSKLYMVNQSNKEIQIHSSSFTQFTASTLFFTIPASVDTGSYHIKLKTGNQVLTKGPIHLDPPFLILNVPANTTTVKRGAELVLQPFNGSLKYYISQISSQAVFYQPTAITVNITSITNSELKIAIPANFPLGDISFVSLKFKDGTEYPINFDSVQVIE